MIIFGLLSRPIILLRKAFPSGRPIILLVKWFHWRRIAAWALQRCHWESFRRYAQPSDRTSPVWRTMPTTCRSTT